MTLGRRLGIADLVVLGLVAMLGSGVFVVFAPAGAAAGRWLGLSVLLAAVVATLCAFATAELAPSAGLGAGYTAGYQAARDRLHPAVGRLAGIALLTGGIGSAAAAAGVFGAYVLGTSRLVTGIVVIAIAAAVNIVGVRATTRASWLLAGGTLVVLLVVVVVGLLGPGGSATLSAAATASEAARGVAVPSVQPAQGVLGVLSAAGLVFFAFIGFANVGTHGEEVRTPTRTLRRAVPIALGMCTLIYLAVAGALLVGLGTDRLGSEHAPLVALVDTGQAPALGVLVRIGAAVAAGSTLLAVLVGVSRTSSAMAVHSDVPPSFGRVCGSGAPWRSDVLGAALAVLVAVLAGPVASIALSAFAMLVHFAIVHVAVLRTPGRRVPAWVPVLGMVLCLGLAALLPATSVLITLGALVVGWGLSELSALRGRRRAAVETEEPPGEQAA